MRTSSSSKTQRRRKKRVTKKPTRDGRRKGPPSSSKNKQKNKQKKTPNKKKKKTQKNRLFSVVIKRETHHDNNIDNARVSVERRQIESGDARRLRRERGGVDLLQPGSQKSDCQHFYGASSSSVTLSCHFSKWDHNDNARRLPRERPFTKRVERTGEGSRVSRETREIEIESERWPRRRRKKAIDVVHSMVPIAATFFRLLFSLILNSRALPLFLFLSFVLIRSLCSSLVRSLSSPRD